MAFSSCSFTRLPLVCLRENQAASVLEYRYIRGKEE